MTYIHDLDEIESQLNALNIYHNTEINEFLYHVDELEVALKSKDNYKIECLSFKLTEFMNRIYNMGYIDEALSDISWVTIEKPSEAKIVTYCYDFNNVEYSHTPVSSERFNQKALPFQNRDWILIHGYAGLFTNSELMPRYIVMKSNATCYDVLQAIYSKTIYNNSKYDIADAIYFEGLGKIADNIWIVSAGS